MKIRLVAYGIAKDILKTRELVVDVNDGATISMLKEKLFDRYPDLKSLNSLSFAIGDNYQKDSYALAENDEVVILPPVSGG